MLRWATEQCRRRRQPLTEEGVEEADRAVRCHRCGQSVYGFMRFCAACGAPAAGAPAAQQSRDHPVGRVVAEEVQVARQPATQPAAPGPMSPPPRINYRGNALASPAARPSWTCVQHVMVPALVRCALCQAPVCGTCVFEYAGGVSLCPVCIATPARRLNRGRWKLLIGSYALAGYSTIGLFVFVVLSVSTKIEEPLASVLFVFLGFSPALAGMAMAAGSYEKRLFNPPAVWISIVWNGLNTLSVLGLVLLGLIAIALR